MAKNIKNSKKQQKDKTFSNPINKPWGKIIIWILVAAMALASIALLIYYIYYFFF